MRKHIVAGNWKMNKTFNEADELVSDIIEKLESIDLDRNTQIILCPPFPYLEMVSDYSDDSYFLVGAQNVSDQESGAYTGEVSAAMLESLELDFCIVGHSERRAYYHETNELVMPSGPGCAWSAGSVMRFSSRTSNCLPALLPFLSLPWLPT